MQAAFDGKDSNDNREVLAFIRKYRPITENAHRTTVLVAAHPVKNAAKDNLLPYGAGSVVNECDGNFTLWKDEESGVVAWHWQGKFRGAQFEPRKLKIEVRPFNVLRDQKNRALLLPIMTALDASEAEKLQNRVSDAKDRLLCEIARNPAGSIEKWRAAAGVKSKASVAKYLAEWAAAGFAAKDGDKWGLTDAGRQQAAEIEANNLKTEPSFACLDDDETD